MGSPLTLKPFCLLGESVAFCQDSACIFSYAIWYCVCVFFDVRSSIYGLNRIVSRIGLPTIMRGGLQVLACLLRRLVTRYRDFTRYSYYVACMPFCVFLQNLDGLPRDLRGCAVYAGCFSLRLCLVTKSALL